MPNSCFKYITKKICLLCQSEFLPTSGRQKCCNECVKNGRADKYYKDMYAKKNKEKIREKQKKYYYENLDHVREIRRKYSRSTKGKEQRKRYYKENKTELLSRSDKFNRENKTSANRIQAKRLMIRNKIEKICIDCGSLKNICIHHVDGNRKNNVIENLVYVCRKCHGNRHVLLNQRKPRSSML